MPNVLENIPIKSIEPHPRFQFRKDYVSDQAFLELKESIRRIGQIHNGVVVKKPDGYQLCVGFRRFFAKLQLYEETGDPKFDSFTAIVLPDADDQDLTAIFAMTLEENDAKEKGVIKPFTALEKVGAFESMSGELGSEKERRKLAELLNVDDEHVRRRLYLADVLSKEGRISKLQEIEKVAKFTFELGHLEKLCALENQESMFEVAAVMAQYRLAEDELSGAEKLHENALNFEWFGEDASSDEEEEDSDAALDQRGIFAGCPSCGRENFIAFQQQKRIPAANLKLKPGGVYEKIPTGEVEADHKLHVRCVRCSKELVAKISSDSNGKQTACVSVDGGPEIEAQVGRLRWDSANRKWLKIVKDGQPGAGITELQPTEDDGGPVATEE